MGLYDVTSQLTRGPFVARRGQIPLLGTHARQHATEVVRHGVVMARLFWHGLMIGPTPDSDNDTFGVATLGVRRDQGAKYDRSPSLGNS